MITYDLSPFVYEWGNWSSRCVGNDKEGGMLQWNDSSRNFPQPLPNWNTLIKSSNLSEPQFPPLENQYQNPYLIRLVRIINHMLKCPVQHLHPAVIPYMCALIISLSWRNTETFPSSFSTKARQKGVKMVMNHCLLRTYYVPGTIGFESCLHLSTSWEKLI